MNRCAAGNELPQRGACPKCGAASSEPCPEALRIAREERETLIRALKRLTNEVAGIWDAFEIGIRQEISNTNYAVVRDKLVEAESVLALVGSPRGQNG